MQIDRNVLPIIYSLFELLCQEHINMWLSWSQRVPYSSVDHNLSVPNRTAHVMQCLKIVDCWVFCSSWIQHCINGKLNSVFQGNIGSKYPRKVKGTSTVQDKVTTLPWNAGFPFIQHHTQEAQNLWIHTDTKPQNSHGWLVSVHATAGGHVKDIYYGGISHTMKNLIPNQSFAEFSGGH
jgi:hypothetical protein